MSVDNSLGPCNNFLSASTNYTTVSVDDGADQCNDFIFEIILRVLKVAVSRARRAIKLRIVNTLNDLWNIFLRSDAKIFEFWMLCCNSQQTNGKLWPLSCNCIESIFMMSDFRVFAAIRIARHFSIFLAQKWSFLVSQIDEWAHFVQSSNFLR